MRTRPLGNSGIQASAIALGAWSFGGWRWGGADEKTSIDALRASVDAGVTLIDTAPVYGFGRGEEVVGKAIAGVRDKVVIISKCGMIWHAEKGQFFFASDDKGRKDDGPIRIHQYLGPEEIRPDLERSLKRLKTDYIDLYLTHWQDQTTPTETVVECLLQLKKEGKIRAIGACNASVQHLEIYHKAGALDADQERYNAVDRKMEETQLPFCRERGVATLAYSPMEHGLLTGKLDPAREYNEGDLRKGDPRFAPDRVRAFNAKLEKLKPMAERHKVTMGSLFLAWTIAQPGLTHALAGARTREQAIENAKAGKIDLSADEIAEIARTVA